MMKLADFVCYCLFVASTFTASSASSGYDNTGTGCDPHSSRSRTGRARLIESIPCDLTKQSYCNLPGEFYPWNAVKKFVYENQGLVRRMYGDMRHIFVMQSELENEIDFDDIQHSADKYSKAFNAHNQRQMKAKKVPVERKNYRSESEPYFRPAQRPSASNSKQKTKPPKISDVDNKIDNSLINDNVFKSNVEVSVGDSDNIEETSLKTTKLTSLPPTTTTAKTISSSTKTEQLDQNTTTDKNRSGSDDDKNQMKEVLDLFNNISSVFPSSSTISPTTMNVKDLSSPSTDENTVKLLSTLKNESIIKLEEELEQEVLNDLEQIASESTTESEAVDKNNSKEPQTTTTETQLFQDTVQKEKEPIIPVVNRRGVNACPTKEEVVAPFWGNNTRGEVLALLNVYPFEQYINWEKCTNEHEQMYCRNGCVCEQQYRLHRLLAYNPLDACRGIFSDWFRFPSCCICKCYDIPFDYRVTSRSPRKSENSYQPEDEINDETFPFDFFDPE